MMIAVYYFWPALDEGPNSDETELTAGQPRLIWLHVFKWSWAWAAFIWLQVPQQVIIYPKVTYFIPNTRIKNDIKKTRISINKHCLLVITPKKQNVQKMTENLIWFQWLHARLACPRPRVPCSNTQWVNFHLLNTVTDRTALITKTTAVWQTLFSALWLQCRRIGLSDKQPAN